MRDEPDMTAPVTRGELHQALGTWSGAIIAQLTAQFTAQFTAQLTAALERFENRLENRLADRFRAVDDRLVAMEDRLMAELRRHTNGNTEQMRTELTVIDEKNKDLPERTTKLEAKVFAPKRGRRS